MDPNTIVGIADGLDLILLSDDELLIQFGTRSQPSELLRDSDLTGLLARTIGPLLNGPAPVGELIAAARPEQIEDARALLTDLVARGILADQRLDPVAQYLGYAFGGEPLSAQPRIAVLGDGPIGSRILGSLQQTGFQSVVQRDAVNAEETAAASDFLILALERPDVRVAHMVNRHAIHTRTPWLLACMDGNFGLVGPLFHPVETACYNDYRVLASAATPSPLMARRHREQSLHGTTRSRSAGLPAYAEIVAGHASLAAVHYLLRGTSFALGRVMVIDFDRMRIDTEDVLKLPRCPVCGTQRSAYRPATPA